MNIQSICIRKKLLGGLSEKWGSPLSVEQFIKSYSSEKLRNEILKKAENIVFFDSDQQEIPYSEAIVLYKEDEQTILGR